MISNSEMTMFLARYAENPNVELAAKQAGISRATIYRLRRQDAKFCRDMDRSKTLWTNALVEKAHGKLQEFVENGKWPAVRYVLEKNSVQYPNPTDLSKPEKIAAKYPELEPDILEKLGMSQDQTTGDWNFRDHPSATFAQETRKYQEKAVAAEIVETAELEERLSTQAQAGTPIVLPTASVHSESIIPAAFREDA